MPLLCLVKCLSWILFHISAMIEVPIVMSVTWNEANHKLAGVKVSVSLQFSMILLFPSSFIETSNKPRCSRLRSQWKVALAADCQSHTVQWLPDQLEILSHQQWQHLWLIRCCVERGERQWQYDITQTGGRIRDSADVWKPIRNLLRSDRRQDCQSQRGRYRIYTC